MTFKTTLLSSALAIGLAGAAAAQSAGDFELTLAYASAMDEDFTNTMVFGQAAGDFGGSSGLMWQVGLGFTSYDGDDSGNTFVGHLGYEVAPNTYVGLYVGREEAFDDSEVFYGLEGLYSNGPLEVEAAYGVLSEDNDFRGFVFDASYEVGSGFSVVGSYNKLYGDGFDYYNYEVGGAYDLGNGLTISALYGDYESDYPYFRLIAEFEIGNGVPFGRRSFAELSPLD